MFAADKVAELLGVFNLSMTEVELAAEKWVERVVESKKTKLTSIYNTWSAVRRLCGIRVWRSMPWDGGYKWHL